MSTNVVITTGNVGEGKTISYDELLAKALRFKPAKILICELKEIDLSSKASNREQNGNR